MSYLFPLPMVGLAANSPFMSTLKNVKTVRRENTGGNGYVYYASKRDIYNRQKKERGARRATQEPLTDSDAITVLVELIKHPNHTSEQLSRQFKRQSRKVDVKAIEGFIEFHEIKKKKRTMHL